MKKLNIRTSDKHFSNCIRESANWECQRCGTYYPEGKRMALHCSHFHGRGKWGTRFDPLNCEALCYGCHMYLTSQPEIHRTEKLARIGEESFNKIMIRSYSTVYGRSARRAEKEISDHYRKEHKRILELRKSGECGVIEIQPFDLV